MNQLFSHAANTVAWATGRPVTFIICCITILAWAVTGPLFHYSDTWQLVINTATTIVNGLPVGAMPMRVRMGERQSIVITAPGFERQEFDLIPTGDRRFPADMKRLGSGKRPR